MEKYGPPPELIQKAKKKKIPAARAAMLKQYLKSKTPAP